MQHIGPRIYRSLEKRMGKDGFDTIVLAALESYLALREPNARQAADLSRLILHSWDRIGQETQDTLKTSLAASKALPTELLQRQASATVPQDPMAQGISASAAIAADRDGAEAFVAASPMLVERPAPPEHLANADTVRETLRRLAQPGRAALQPLAGPSVPVSMADILEFARSGDAALVYDAICRWLRLVPQQAAAMADDATGIVLARVLKASRAAEADAITLITLLKPAISVDVFAFESLKQDFRNLEIDECRSALGLPSVLPQMALPEPRRSGRMDAYTRGPETEARQVFGRRRLPPMRKETYGKSR